LNVRDFEVQNPERGGRPEWVGTTRASIETLRRRRLRRETAMSIQACERRRDESLAKAFAERPLRGKNLREQPAGISG
jgi:hypothetical protein